LRRQRSIIIIIIYKQEKIGVLHDTTNKQKQNTEYGRFPKETNQCRMRKYSIGLKEEIKKKKKF